MAYFITDWKARVTPLDVLNAQGEPLVVYWMPESDDVVGMNLGPMLDEGETLNPATVETSMVRLRAQGESADLDQSAETKVGDPQVSGTYVTQRLAELETGRYYRLRVMHGVAGNRRGASLFIYCVE